MSGGNTEAKREEAARRGRALAVVPVAASVAVLVGTLLLADRGLDLMDESYILRLITFPEASRPAGEVYLFAFVVNPVLGLVGGDIARFRVVGVLALALLSVGVCRDFLRLAASGPVRRRDLWPALAPAAAASVLVFTLGVRLLGYRAVALAGLLALAWGLARLALQQDWSGGILVGLGIWVTFVGKPTSAVVAVVVCLAAGGPLRLFTKRIVTASAVGAALGVFATLLLARMSPGEAVDYLRGGARIVALLGDHPSVLRMLGVGPTGVEAALVFGLPLVLVLVLGLVARSRVGPTRRGVIDWMTMAGLVAVTIATAWAATKALGPRTQGLQILPLVVILPVLVGGVMLRYRPAARGERTKDTRILVLVLCVLPYAFAAGSNVSIAMTTAQAGVLWVIALATAAVHADHTDTDVRALPSGLSGRGVLLMTVSVAVVSIVSWVGYVDGPEGPQLTRATEVVKVGDGQLRLKPEDAAVARSFQSAAQDARLTGGVPVVDLTGAGAGYTLFLGAPPLGRAHLYGTWAGGPESAAYALGRTSCEDRAAAWLLYSPDNPSDTSEGFTQGVLSLDVDYDVVVAIRTSQYGRDKQVQLLKPRTSVREALGC